MNGTSDIQNRYGNSPSFGDVIKGLVRSGAKNLNVACVARLVSTVQEFDSDKGYGVYRVQPVTTDAKSDAYEIEAYAFKEPGDNKFFAVLFADLDFRAALDTDRPVEPENSNLHSRSFGIII